MAKKRKKSQRSYLVVIGLLIVGLSILLVSYIANKDVYLNIDDNAIKENDKNTDKMEVSPGGGAVSLEYSNQVAINKDTQKISMYLKNPSKSRENISIEIYMKNNNKDILIGESKMIPTGYSIKELTLKDIEVNEGEYKGYIKVFFYNEKTNKKEIIDSKINVEIKVN